MGNGQYLQLMFRYGAYYATMIVLLVLGMPRLDDLAPDVMAKWTPFHNFNHHWDISYSTLLIAEHHSRISRSD